MVPQDGDLRAQSTDGRWLQILTLRGEGPEGHAYQERPHGTLILGDSGAS